MNRPEVFIPDLAWTLIMEYCDTRSRDDYNKVLDDLLLVMNLERCQELFLDELEEADYDEDNETGVEYDMTMVDPIVQETLKGLFVRSRNLDVFICDTIFNGEGSFLWQHWDRPWRQNKYTWA